MSTNLFKLLGSYPLHAPLPDLTEELHHATGTSRELCRAMIMSIRTGALKLGLDISRTKH